MDSLGSRIREQREAKNWSQAELGKILGVAAATVHRYEVNERRPDPDTLVRLADLFAVSSDYLLGRSSPDPDPQVRAILRSVRGLSEVERQDVLNYIAWKQAQLRQKKQQESDPQGELGLI